MADKKFETWVHVKITDKELAEQLDAMSDADLRDRSKMVRWLIQQEWQRRNRNSQAHYVGDYGAHALPIAIKTEAV
jgi:metal-responsive CopG/Arc/MetJ family transcriptional regulator